MRARIALAVLFATSLLGCRDYATLCPANDPSVKPAQCWNAGYSIGEHDGREAAQDTGYAAGMAACAEDTDAR